MSEQDNNNSPSDGGNNPANDKSDVKNKGSKTFTQEEFGQKLSSERNKMREQFEKEKTDAVNAAIAEYERKAKLSEEEKASEAQKEREQKLAEREREVTLRERKAEAVDELSKKNLPTAFVDFVLNEDADIMAKNIEKLEKSWSEELKAAVKKAVSGDTPTDKSGTDKANVKTTTPNNVYKRNGVSAF